MLLLIDFRDSFTSNLEHLLAELEAEVEVRSASGLTLDQVTALRPERIVLSSGPGGPPEAGLAQEVIAALGQRVPILGVGLGHLSVAYAFGGATAREGTITPGIAAMVYHQGKGVLRGLPSPFEAGCYHSLAVDRSALPPELEITAQTTTGAVMALRHRAFPIQGVQFHPESLLTPCGKDVLRNFLG